MKIHGDERGVILDWLLKVTVGLAIFGVILFDAGAIAVNYFSLDSAAQEIAIAITTDIDASPSHARQLQATAEAKALAKEAGARLVSARIDSQERIFYVRLRRRAKTLLVGRFEALKHWTRATANGQAGTQ